MYPARPHAADTFPGVIFVASIAAQSTINDPATRESFANSAGERMRKSSSSFMLIVILKFLFFGFEDEDDDENEEDSRRRSTPASPNRTGVQIFSTAGSRSARRQISGPMPAGSPIVKPNTGRALFIFRSANAIRSCDAGFFPVQFPKPGAAAAAPAARRGRDSAWPPSAPRAIRSGCALSGKARLRRSSAPNVFPSSP